MGLVSQHRRSNNERAYIFEPYFHRKTLGQNTSKSCTPGARLIKVSRARRRKKKRKRKRKLLYTFLGSNQCLPYFVNTSISGNPERNNESHEGEKKKREMTIYHGEELRSRETRNRTNFIRSIAFPRRISNYYQIVDLSFSLFCLLTGKILILFD